TLLVQCVQEKRVVHLPRRRLCVPLMALPSPEVPDRSHVVLEVLSRVLLDSMGLEETVEFIPGGNAQQRPQLQATDTALAVRLQSDGLQRSARWVGATAG